MALTEPQLATITAAVAARITGTVLGREASSSSAVESGDRRRGRGLLLPSGTGRARGDLARGGNKARGLVVR